MTRNLMNPSVELTSVYFPHKLKRVGDPLLYCGITLNTEVLTEKDRIGRHIGEREDVRSKAILSGV